MTPAEQFIMPCTSDQSTPSVSTFRVSRMASNFQSASLMQRRTQNPSETGLDDLLDAILEKMPTTADDGQKRSTFHSLLVAGEQQFLNDKMVDVLEETFRSRAIFGSNSSLKSH